MGEVEETPGSGEKRERALAAVPAWLTGQPAIAYSLALAFAAATFAVYWYLGPQNTAAVQYVDQANAFLHGRLDIVPEFAKNYALIEKACDKIENGACTPDAKVYITHPPMPAIVLLPGVVLFGLNINATLVSAVMGGLTAPVVFGVARHLTKRVSVQVWLTLLFMFGTIFWYTASHGGVWFFSHTVGVFFLFLAIYTTLVRRNPLLTGLFVGAAYLSRQSMIMSLPFFVVMFSELWLPRGESSPPWRRVHLTPLVQLGSGVAVLLVLSFVFNYLRFDNPLDSGYYHSEQVKQPQLAHVYNHGPLHWTYVSRHIEVAFEQMPVFQQAGPYVRPSWWGLAIWASTPAFLVALFASIRDRRVKIAGMALLALSMIYMLTRAAGRLWDADWETFDAPNLLPGRAWGLHLVAFYAMIAIAIGASATIAIETRGGDKLAIACWAAIILITLPNFFFAATGWTQFGYRYGLDFYPFLFLLTAKAIGDNIRWYHIALIVISIVVNLWGVVWIYQAQPSQWLGWTWIDF